MHLLTAALMLAAPVSASELGTDLKLHFSSDAIATYAFESASAMAPLLHEVQQSATGVTWVISPAGAGSGLVVADANAPEGNGYLHFTAQDGLGLAIIDAATFAAVANQRIQVSFWGRSEGMEPVVSVTWGNESDISTTESKVWARVPAIRTGRETSDGWAEYSTGPIDGSVIDRPIHDLLLTGRVANTSANTGLLFANPPSLATDAFSLDAIELRPAPGAISSGTCTAATVDQACGAQGECFFGRCVDSATKWHPAPSLDQQQQIAARVVTWMTNFLGDRAAAARADAGWVSQTLGLASATATAKTFWGGLRRQLNILRDTHTSLGNPYNNITTPFAFFVSTLSGPLDVCFGPTVNDLGDGKLAYVIWKRGMLAPAALHIGDVVTAIDGEDPKAWVDRINPLESFSLPVVPIADWADTSVRLSSMLALHAGTLSVTRCAPGGACMAQPAFDVASAALQAVSNGQTGNANCSVRFTETTPGPLADANGLDVMSVGSLDAQTVALEFDGFDPSSTNGGNAWVEPLLTAVSTHPARVLVDAREGHGGFGSYGDTLIAQFRGVESPVSLIIAGRAAFDAPDAAPIFFDWSSCLGNNIYTWQCAATYVDVQQTAGSPAALDAKVAWLNTNDVSENDIVPAMLKGRANLRIFSPFPTYGAFGSRGSLPALVTNMHDGTMALGDSRLGVSVQAAESQSGWLSGTGVPPDQLVTQTLSDVLAGKDTIVSAAREWLAQ
ncbi:MAG TPA: hypothetical protein VH083_04865 [Myxococcales bacterium]|nr:hypothetical protein [Myxococcales bacterium]